MSVATGNGFMPYPEVPSSHSPNGSLSGLTFAVKDLFHIQGYPTSAGHPLVLAQSGIQKTTAPTVCQLLDAGALLTGKTVTDEFAFSIIGDNVHFGAPLNPVSPNRYAGGSSSGSAAVVAAKLVDFSIGTDTGGSVRVPASNCGLFGIRPSHGRVSLEGCIGLAPSFDTCGWFSRDLGVFARVSDLLLGTDRSTLLRTTRLIEPEDLWARQDAMVTEAMSAPRAKIRGLFAVHETTCVALGSLDTMLNHFRTIQSFESWKMHGQFIQQHNPVLGPGVAERFELGRLVSEREYSLALRFQADFHAWIDDVLEDDGVMVYPTVSQPAPLRNTALGDLDAYRKSIFRSLCVAGLGGLPQITLPLARIGDAHLGLSLVGPRGSDHALAALAETMARGFWQCESVGTVIT